MFSGSDNSETNFAWAVHAGLAYEVNDKFTVDIGYRYMDLGDASSGEMSAYDGSSSYKSVELDDLHSHDLMVGMRWKLDRGGSRLHGDEVIEPRDVARSEVSSGPRPLRLPAGAAEKPPGDPDHAALGRQRCRAPKQVHVASPVASPVSFEIQKWRSGCVSPRP